MGKFVGVFFFIFVKRLRPIRALLGRLYGRFRYYVTKRTRFVERNYIERVEAASFFRAFRAGLVTRVHGTSGRIQL